MLYQILFHDKTVLNGGESYLEPKWGKVPNNKQIVQIIFFLPYADALILKGYEKYYYRIEGCTDLNGKKAGQKTPEYIFIYGKIKNKTMMYKCNIKNGNVERKIKDIQDKEIQRLNPEFWR